MSDLCQISSVHTMQTWQMWYKNILVLRCTDVVTFADMVKRLVRPWCGKGRNITMDNFFTSIPLAEDLFAEKATIVGTLQKNHQE
ncbi:hypothetical protein T11_16507 [Trichinella zimbabwensis]|uniref:PiggyBac transposable element-derived protein domain-containing protein n=1 Tax=Trichinella zimbabwensis TaxID=268475 RepID=A0A0V1H964_9BILA|nr:hypothetical protein T11_16507 [Trichinella zimbabwensis]